MSVTGHPFDNIAYGSARWREEEDSVEYYNSDLKFSSTLPNEVRINVNSRAKVGGHDILFQTTESVILPTSVASPTTFYFFVAANAVTKTYGALDVSSNSFPSVKDYEGIQQLPLAKLTVKAGVVNVDINAIVPLYVKGDKRVFNLTDGGMTDARFVGKNSDACFEEIFNEFKQFAPCIVMDYSSSGRFPSLRTALVNDPRFLINNTDFNRNPHFIMEIPRNEPNTGGFLKVGYDNSTKTQNFKFDNDFIGDVNGYGTFIQQEYNNYLKGEALYKRLLWQGSAGDGDTFNISAKFSDYPIIRFDFLSGTYLGHIDVYYVQGTEIARGVGTFAFELSETTKMEIIELLVRFETQSTVKINKCRGMNLFAGVDDVVKSDFRSNFQITEVYGMKN